MNSEQVGSTYSMCSEIMLNLTSTGQEILKKSCWFRDTIVATCLWKTTTHDATRTLALRNLDNRSRGRKKEKRKTIRKLFGYKDAKTFGFYGVPCIVGSKLLLVQHSPPHCKFSWASFVSLSFSMILVPPNNSVSSTLSHSRNWHSGKCWNP